ncbi:hypothetical protein EDB19DRAFT_1627726, partial [Suillus lakei]
VIMNTHNVIGRTPSEQVLKSSVHPDQLGYINQRVLSCKACRMHRIDVRTYIGNANIMYMTSLHEIL